MKRNDISKFFKPVSKTPKIDSDEQNTDVGLEVMAVIEENNENQNDQIDIRSKLVKEFEEKLASYGFKLNSALDLVSSEIDPSIETEIVTKACDKIEQPSNESEIRIVEQYHPPSNFKFPSKKIGTGKNQWSRSCNANFFEKWKWLHYTGYLIAKFRTLKINE